MLIDALGFDESSVLADCFGTAVIAANDYSIAVSSLAARTGSKGIRISGTSLNIGGSVGGSGYVGVSFGQALATVYFGIAVKPRGWAVTDDLGQFITFTDGGLRQCSIHIINGGQIAAYRGSTLLGTSTRALVLNKSSFLNIGATIHDSAGAITVKVNGATWLTLSSINTRGGTSNNQTTSYAIGKFNPSTAGGLPLNIDFDDVHYNDGTGSYNNTYLGDQSVKVSLPTGDGTTTDYTRGGTDSGANWSQVNEVPPDEDTKYLTDATVGHKNRFTYPAITGVTITAVIVKPRARKDDGTARSIRTVAKLGGGGTEADNGVDFPLSTDYAYYSGVHERDPDGAAWTQSSVNAAEFGVKTSV